MSTVTLDHTYRYAYQSHLREASSRGDELALNLATCDAKQQQPYFFNGRMLAPRETGEMLMVLGNVVRTHFFKPLPPLLDPVVTSNESMLRFEGFSGCCGVYVRADLPAEAFDMNHLGKGTTNVDFNNPMRAALSRLRNESDVRLAVGNDGVELTDSDQSVFEKKVKLPIRWLKGFSEVQNYQPTLSVKIEADGIEAKRFVRSLPNSSPKTATYIKQTGKSLRLSPRPSDSSVKFMGTHRVKVLEPLLSTAKQLRIWSDDEAGTSAWEVILKAGRFFLMLSPEVYRGFSGEGQALEKLAGNDWKDALDIVQQQLKWQAQIDIDELSVETKLAKQQIEAALAVLGSRGLAGFDAGRGAYFHRELPFDFKKVDQLQPRLKGAKKLIEADGVEIIKRIGSEEADVQVAGTGVQHFVRLRNDGDKCSCPWFSKYQGKRGPCKHVLAARMIFDV